MQFGFYLKKNDEVHLSKIISDISKQHESAIFTPHITVYGLIDTELETIHHVVLQSINDVKSFNIKKNTISISEYFWKTLFIDFY